MIKNKKRVEDNIEIARKELAREKLEKTLRYSFFFVFFASSFILLSFITLDYLGLTGYVTYVASKAGDVTTLDIIYKFPTEYWGGVYGFALRVPGLTEQFNVDVPAGTILRKDVFFECLDMQKVGGPEMFISTHPSLDFSSILPGSLAAVDALNGCTYQNFCANYTFTDTMNITINGDTITEIPATYTYRYDGENEIFQIGVLNISGKLAFVTKINSTFQKGYSPDYTVNYQLLLPTPISATTRYYFFSDPYAECPPGGIGNSLEANVYGYIKDVSNNPLANASVTIAGYSAVTNSQGFYNISYVVLPGTYNIIAQKSGYLPGFSNVTVSFSNYVHERNITLEVTPTGFGETLNVVVYGKVTDDEGAVLSAVFVALGNNATLTNSTGDYYLSVTVSEGENPLLAFKQGYDNYYAFLNFSSSNLTINKNIVLFPVNPNTFPSGPFPTGPYTEEVAQAQREAETTGLDFWVSTTEINRQVRRNTFVNDRVSVYNFKTAQMQVLFELSGDVEEIIRMNKNSVSVVPGSSDFVTLTIFGTKPVGIYTGKLTLSGDIQQEIPITIEIVDRAFQLESLVMDINLFKKQFRPGEEVRFSTNLQNFLAEQSYMVNLDYEVVATGQTEVFYKENENVEIFNTLTILKSFVLPEEIKDGSYVLKLEAKYLNMYSNAIASFDVVTPLYLYSFFGIPLWIILVVISALSFILFNLMLYRAHLQRKKRYRLELNKDLLPRDGPRAMKIGKIAETNLTAFYDLDALTTHAIIAGATGGGKSISAQVLVEEALMKNIAVVVFDPTAQWSGMLRKCDDKKMMSLYPKFGLKPTDAKAFPGNVRLIKDARQAIDIKKYINPGQIQILSLNKLDPSEMDTFVSSVIVSIFRSSPEEHPGLRVLLVFDEVHRLLPKFGGSGKGFLQIERACREFRKWGFGVMLVSQVLSDFVGEIKANINTEVQVRVAEENDLNRIKERYGPDALKSLVKADVGVAMMQNAEYNRGLPYFVAFRPILHNTRRLSDEVLEKYNHYGEIIEDLDYQIEQLEAEKIDTFDLKMELKLVKDKLMTGNFSVVDIYLEGLLPRFEKQWQNLGKKPKKKQLELVDQKDVEASIAAAEKDRKKWEEKEKKENIKEEKKIDSSAKLVKPITFDNGMMVSSFKELRETLPSIDNETFAIHVNKEKNEIADWIAKEIDKDFGEKIKSIIEKDKLVEEINNYGKEKPAEKKDDKKENIKEEKVDEKKAPEKDRKKNP